MRVRHKSIFTEMIRTIYITIANFTVRNSVNIDHHLSPQVNRKLRPPLISREAVLFCFTRIPRHVIFPSGKPKEKERSSGKQKA